MILSVCDEIGACPQAEVHLKLDIEVPFCVWPYVITEEQKPVIEKEMDCLEKLGIIKKGLKGYSTPGLLVKRKHQNIHCVFKWLLRSLW